MAKPLAKIVLVSPIANENVEGVSAADLNNRTLQSYVKAMARVAKREKVGFVNCFNQTKALMKKDADSLTINGCHLNQKVSSFGSVLYEGLIGKSSPL